MHNVRKMIAGSFVKLVDDATTHAISLGELFNWLWGTDVDALFLNVIKLYGYSDEDLNYEVFSGGLNSAWLVREMFRLPDPYHSLCGIKTSSLRVKYANHILTILFENDPIIDAIEYGITNVELMLRPFSNAEEIAKAICDSQVTDRNRWDEFARRLLRLHDLISDYCSVSTLPLDEQLIVTYIDKVAEQLVAMSELCNDDGLLCTVKSIIKPDNTRWCDQNEAHGD